MKKSVHLLISISSLLLLINPWNGSLSAAQWPIAIHKNSSASATNIQQAEVENLWAILANHFCINSPITPEIQAQIDWYQANPHAFYSMTEQASPYLYYILQKVIASDLPGEVTLLPMIESNYNPLVSSAAGAGGLWQLMPDTAAELGVRQNWWYDGRRDITASTEAALAYLNYLQTLFDGNWLLTLAAYNSGAGSVQHAIDKNMQAGLPTHFWDLPLPQQTRNYIPHILAIAAIIKEPEKYKIVLPPLKNGPHLKAVEVDKQIGLAKAATLAGIDVATLHQLNPGYKRWATEPHRKHKLLLPINVVNHFKEKLAHTPAEKLVMWDKYKVQPNDTLLKIAHSFYIKPELLKEINNLHDDTIKEGDILHLPLGSRDLKNRAQINGSPSKVKNASHRSAHKTVHTIQHGESIWTIAKKYKVSRAMLCQWNNFAPDQELRAGDKLTIYRN